jgi:Ca-activated chloride channel homolog
MRARVLTGVLLALVAVVSAGHVSLRAAPEEPALAVRITSPLGRTGLPGPIRIVAQIQQTSALPPREVRFFVDQQLLRTVEHAPWVAEWIDSNPFERSEIVVEAVDAAGNAARDRVVLEPFEVNESAEVSSVLLEAAVQDRHGRFVRNLPPDVFSLLEDDTPQQLDLVMQESVGATFALLVDSSASMSRRMDFVHRTAATLAGYMTDRDRMLVAPFSKQLLSTTGPTDDAATIREAIGAISPAGGTAILDAVVQVTRSFEGVEGRRAIVLITDGYDEHSVTTFDEALAAVKAAHATVYVVGIGGVAGISLRGERLLRQLAEETGGRAFFPATAPQLASVHETLTEDVANRYLITYTPDNQTLDGRWRAITVMTDDPEHRIRTRAGYFAPKPPPIRPNIELIATDVDGTYIDLTADDLEVTENGETQEIETFQEAVQPVSIILALDASGSMRRREQDVIDSARHFVDALRPEDRLALVLFADKVQFVHDLSTNRAITHRAIEQYRAVGGTALYDALADSLIRLKAAGEGRHVVVVMTDGRDENNPGTAPGSIRTFADVLKQQHETRATIFPIGLGTQVDAGLLRQLADVSGGQAFFPEDVEDLGREYQRVIEDLRRRYVIGYTSTLMQRDGSWREVEIRVKDRPDASVRTSGGYYAPGQ